MGFSSQSEGASCYGNCICLQDPQIAEPINPFHSRPPPPLSDPAVIGSKQPQRPNPDHQLTLGFPTPSCSVFPPLGFLPTFQLSSSSCPHFPLCLLFPLVCLSLQPCLTPGSSKRPFLIPYPDCLPLERVPLPHCLGPSQWSPACLPSTHYRTINQPPAYFLGPLPPTPFTALSSPMYPEVSATTLSPPHGLCILALARSAQHPLLVRPAHTSLIIALSPIGLSVPASFLFLPIASPASFLVSPLHHSFLFLGPAACLLRGPPWPLISLSLHPPLLSPCCLSLLHQDSMDSDCAPSV